MEIKAELNDQQVIKKYLRGDNKSLDVLVKKYLKIVYNFSFRYVTGEAEAEDLTQETFIRVWRNLNKFDTERNFKTWLLAIAQNVCLDYLKKKKAVPFSRFEGDNGDNLLFETLADEAPLVSELLENKDKTSWLAVALAKLSEKSRQVITLHHKEELTFKEIAEKLDEPIDTVKSRYRRALIDLRKVIEI